MFGLKRFIERRKIKKERRQYVRSLIKEYFPNLSPRGRQKDFYTAFGKSINYRKPYQLTVPNKAIERIHGFIMEDFPQLRDPGYLLHVAVDYTVGKKAEVTVRCDQRDINLSATY